jgi:hypothetical protein
MATLSANTAVRTVGGFVNYLGPMSERPRYYANDHSRDVLNLENRRIDVADARTAADPPRLDREGFTLVEHRSAVGDFRDRDEVTCVHRDEIAALLKQVTGADAVIVSAPGVLRFSERSTDSGRFDNSYPARFVHIDISDATARAMAERAAPEGLTGVKRFAHYNVWRVLSEPPQDAPLTVCDARTLRPEDLVAADAIFDSPGQPEWSFEGLLVRYSAAHRWWYWSNMHSGEALVFKTSDSDPTQPHNVPHSAFDDPTCPPDAPPRASIEMRGVALWYD